MVPGRPDAAALVCIDLHGAGVLEHIGHVEDRDSFVGWVDRTDYRTYTRFHIRREERRTPARETDQPSRRPAESLAQLRERAGG